MTMVKKLAKDWDRHIQLMSIGLPIDRPDSDTVRWWLNHIGVYVENHPEEFTLETDNYTLVEVVGGRLREEAR